jgi:hypothetical protein
MSRKYKLGDRFRHDFDYDGMVEMALQTNSTWSISDLQKLYDSMEDVNYHTANKYLGSAIFALENDLPDVADIKFEKFHKELKEEENYAKGGSINKRKKYTYIPKEEIESITTWNGNNITQEKILDGAYVRGNVKYADGGEMDSLKIKIEEDGDNYEVNYQFDDYEITGVLQKYYTGRANEYEFQPSWFADEESEKYYDENWENIEDEILNVFYSKFKKGGKVKRSKYGEGGSVEQGNLEMMKNQAIQVKHHADELIEILKSSPRVDAWVVSLMDRATQNLSNITHYLDGELKHFAKGGMVNDESIIARYSDKERNVEGIYFFETGKLYEVLSISKPSLKISYNKENAAEVGSFDSKQDAMQWLEKNSRTEGYYDNLNLKLIQNGS